MKENPYEPTQLDESDSNRSMLVFVAFALAILVGAGIWQNLAFVWIPACVLLVFVMIRLATPSSADREEQWPAISDDDFVAKCAPGTDRETALKVRLIVSEQLGVDYDRVHPDKSFASDLGCE